MENKISYSDDTLYNLFKTCVDYYEFDTAGKALISLLERPSALQSLVNKNNIEYDIDYKIGYPRTELKCSNCGGHLGHMFNDGPRETTGKRHCINGAALIFIEK